MRQLREAGTTWVNPSTGEVIDADRAWQESDRRIAISQRQRALLAAAGETGPTAQWYVLEVAPGHDSVVDKQLEDARIERWMAAKTIDARRRGARRWQPMAPKTVPFLPGYLFVRVVWCAPCWHALAGLKGVRTVIGGALRPAPVPDGMLLKLRAFIEKDPTAIDVLTKALKAGDAVRVDHGPFTSFPGVVERVYETGRALVEVMIFGRSVRVDLALAQVTKTC